MTIGEKLGPYEITGLLGKGGMGEVYRATDTRLPREVAVKVSAEQFGDRFTREARAVASLNHPNICTLHDVGPNYLVMELVEGPTLAERIKQGPIEMEEALAIARQIADALEAAHEKGITHRDLKPANVKIRPDGMVKVLDFGLAKMAEPAGQAGSDPAHSPTLTLEAATRPGVVMGTAAYMAPEQAKGKRVDKRADIWAFGVVLYEMVTGRRLFQGEDLADILASVVKEQPNLSAAPVKVRRLLGRCLEKDPRKRLRDISVAMELVEAEDAREKPAPARPRLAWLPWALAAALAVALGVVSWRAVQPAGRSMLRVEASIDAGSGNRGIGAMFSPDGNRLVYLSPDGQGKQQLWTRRMDQARAILLEGTADALEPFFSPDGQWIAFAADGKLKKIPAEGGSAQTICDAPQFRGGSWGEDGNIIASLDLSSPLMRVSALGGKPELLLPFDETSKEARQRWPQVLPGGEAVLFVSHTRGGNYDDANIDVLSLKDGKRKTVHHGAAWARYLPTGHLIYTRRRTLFAVPFDAGRMEKTGTAVPILEDVGEPAGGRAMFGYSLTGDAVYQSGIGFSTDSTISWLHPDGRMTPLPAKPGLYFSPRISPDGKRLALSHGESLDIWVYEWQRDTMSRLTFGTGQKFNPVWSPNGEYVVYSWGGNGIHRVKADGSGKPEMLVEWKAAVQRPCSISPDGKRLLYMEVENQGGPNLLTVSLDADGAKPGVGKPEPFLRTEFIEVCGVFSPDGRWIAYTSNESGSEEVYVRPFPDTGGKWMVSNGGGDFPVWAPGGSELYYLGAGSRIMAAGYTVKAGSLAWEKPRVWSEAQLPDRGAYAAQYDIAPDGKRFAVLVPASPDSRALKTIFLFHFFDELKRRVPVR